MIGMFYIHEDFCILQLGFQFFGGCVVINTPAFIVVACICALAPPRILVQSFRMKMPERIDKTAVKIGTHPFAFFRQKARAFFISNRIMNIYCLMADIVISGNDNFWSFFF